MPPVLLPALIRHAWLLLFCLLAGLPAQAATYTNASTPYSWINPSGHTKLGHNTSPYKLNGGGGCATTPPVTDDTISDPIPIGFSFVYGTTTYTTVRVMTNGRLQFNNSTCGFGTSGFGPQTYALPYPDGSLNNTMRVFGADLDPTNLVDKPNYPSASSKTSCANISSCYISVATIGNAPQRKFVVSWVQVPEWVNSGNTSGSFTVQMILNEDGSFVYQYNSITHGGDGTAQVGWQLSTSDYTVLSFGASSEPANGTAIKFYIAAAVLADYRFEEGAWAPGVAGQVRDSSGNGFHGTAVGLAQTASGGYVCRGMSVTANSEAGNVYGADTGLPMNDSRTNLLGNGVAMLWVKLDDPWSGGSARNAQLLDATTVSGEWFQVTKRSDGTVRFTVTDSTGVVRSATSAAFNHAAGTWQHVAIYWSFNGNPGSNQDYIGVVVNAGTLYYSVFSTDGTLATSLGNLFVGDNPSGFTASGHSVNSASGLIDGVKVINYIPSNAQFLSLKGATHACDTYTLNHLELRHESWSGVGCSPATITVLACADSSFPCTNPYTQGAVATLSVSGSTVTWVPAGNATTVIPWGSSTATKQFYIDPGTATLGASASPAASAVTRCDDSGGNCRWSSASSGLLLSAPTVIGGKLTAVTVQAVSSSGGSCSSVSNTGNGMRLWAEPVSPASFAGYSFSGSTLVGGPPTASPFSSNAFAQVLPQSQPGFENINALSFDASSRTTVYLKHMNTGRFTLSARLDTNAPVQTLVGSTTINVLPSGLAVGPAAARAANTATQTACASGPSASCDSAAGAAPRTGSAGDTWSLQVAGALWTSDSDTDLTDNPVAPSFAATVTLSPQLLAPQGGVAGSLNVGSLVVSGGSASTTQGWTQSGALRVLASTSYLGSTVSGQSVALGRFTPKYFRTTLQNAGCGSFTYNGQPMLGVSVAAMDGSATPDVTPNYSGSFARTVTISDASGAAGTMSANTLAASAFAGGLASGSATASPVFSFTSKASGPYTLLLRASDGETSSSGTVGAEATALHRSGRLRLSNAFGNAGSALQIPLALEYWGGSSWVPNSADACSTLATSAVALSNPRNPAGGSSTASTSVSSVTLSAGSGRITLAAPAGNSGLSLDLALNLGSTGVDQSCNTSHPATTGAALPWLRSNQGSCASTADRDPAARASFGIFSPETRKTVHVRELF